MRIIALFLVLLLITAPGFARTYRILGVENYPGSDSDLSNADADAFDSEMGSASITNWFTNGWTKEGYYKDAAVTASKFKPSSKVDYIYFTGHGSNGYACLSDGNRWISFTRHDLGRVSTVKHIIFACCLSVDTGSSWNSCFGSGLKSILGYKKVSFEWYDTKVAVKFADLISKIKVDASEDHVDAWMNANNLWFSDKLADRWTGIGYSRTDNKLCFWQPRSAAGTRNSQAQTLLPPTMSLAEGKIKVYIPLDDVRGPGEKMAAVSAAPSEIPQMDILKGAMPASRSVNSDIKTYELADATIAVYKSGALVYMKNTEQADSTISAEQALEKAYAFAAKNGGIPEDFSYSNAIAMTRTDIETGEEHTVGYNVSWTKTLNGVPVSGGMGDGINVFIKGDDVSSYYRLCRQAAAPSLDETLRSDSLLPVQTALQNAAPEILKAIKTPEDIKITGVEKTYHSPDFDSKDAVYKPAYMITLSDGTPLYIDARTGSLLW